MNWLGYLILAVVTIFLIYQIASLFKAIKQRKLKDGESKEDLKNVMCVPESKCNTPVDIVADNESNNINKEETTEC